MNKEQKRAKKTAKANLKRKKYIRERNLEKRDRIMTRTQETTFFKFAKLMAKNKREEKMKEASVTM